MKSMSVIGKPANRLRKLGILKRLTPSSQGILNRMIAKRNPQGERLFHINNSRNAITMLNALRKGNLTEGNPESPASIARKLREGNKELTLYQRIIAEGLERLGYREVLEKEGLEKALARFYAEYDKAR